MSAARLVEEQKHSRSQARISPKCTIAFCPWLTVCPPHNPRRGNPKFAVAPEHTPSPEWKMQQKILWAEVLKKTKRWKSR